MSYQANRELDWVQRFKIALHYVLPQLALTRAAGWLAERRWGRLTHWAIRLFAYRYGVNWHEAVKQPSEFASFNEFFIRELKIGVRPVDDTPAALCFPADGRVSEAGVIDGQRLIQAKGHDFTLVGLLAGHEEIAAQFADGLFVTTYLSPRDYHRVHMPCDGRLRRMVYVPGMLFSVNPFLAEHIPYLFARNERLICVFDTNFGPMVQILVGATITASISTVWEGVINPPRAGVVRVWDYQAEGEASVFLRKGTEMGAFRLGSTVINLFAPGRVVLGADVVAGRATLMGSLMARAAVLSNA